MNHATMLEQIKAKIEHADPATLQSIWEIFDQTERRSTAVPEPAVGSAQNRADKKTVPTQPLKFSGENLTLEEYKSLSLDERGMLQWHLKQKNHQWLQETFSTLDAAWLVVVDSQVIASGKSLDDYPMPPQILEICQRTGKFPFIFINDQFVTIEEGISSWHETNKIGDFYPTISFALSSASNVAEIVGDFDTGASRTFVDYGFLTAHNIIQPDDTDYSEASLHLNQRFVYIAKLLRIVLPANSSEANTLDARIFCVPNWHLSPFVKINPNRVALIGRDILLKLKPKVLLDFEQRQTEIIASAAIKEQP
jgi:hypothetical protein